MSSRNSDPIPLQHLEPEAIQPVPEHGSSEVSLQHKAAFARLEESHIIPSTGGHMVATKLEYFCYTIWYWNNNGAPIGNNGGALQQALINKMFPNGTVQWGGQSLPRVNSMLLDVNGIQFAVQLVVLWTIGSYADYGSFRNWIMIGAALIQQICQFGLCGFKDADQWRGAQTLYVIGNLAQSICNAFFFASCPSMVRDLPKVIQSEEDARDGLKTPEEHAKLDAYERSKLYNWLNVAGAALVVVFYGAAIGISAHIDPGNAAPIYTYRVLLAYYGSVTVLCTWPLFFVMKKRPGQQRPVGVPWYLIGPTQVWSALKSVRQLKQILLYLVAYFMLQETYGTYYTVLGIVQNEVINYSPTLLNAMSMVADLCGGVMGAGFLLILQKKVRFSVKSAVFVGSIMTLLPNLWGGIGAWTHVIGFHHVWEFWLAKAYNFATAAWDAYQYVMITELVPAPKMFMFFAMFNVFGKTSGFIGPFVVSAIIRQSGNNNVAFWFLFAMGSVGATVLFFVDPQRAQLDNAQYLEREAQEYYSSSGMDEVEVKADEG